MRTDLRFSPSLALLTVVGLVAGMLAGCGAAPHNQNAALPALQGMVRGGQQPVSGASIKLYSAGADGYGSAATSLLTSAVTSNAKGSFTITGLYHCPTSDTQVYLVASGGNPSQSMGTNNTALALMAALGPCGNLSSSTFVNIDEVTTVASVYGLAQFMATGGGTNLGASSTNALGLANAFATVNNLVNVGNGTAPGASLPSGATAPTAELNTLADLLATCVNSDGATGECSSLFAAATPSGGSAPTNTIDAILDIAQNPGNNVSALYNLVTGTPPFQPTLGSTPNDWTLMVNYVGGGLDAPYTIAIDAQGGIWAGSTGPTLGPTLSKFSSAGVPLSPPAGFTGGGLGGTVFTIAVDSSGNVWSANETSSSLSEFSNSGAVLSPPTGYIGGGLAFPTGISIDGSDNVWTANFDNRSLSKFSNDGTSLSPPGGYAARCLSGTAGGIGIDGSGNVWAVGDDCLSEFSGGGVALSPSGGYTGGGLQFPERLGIDAFGNLWVTNANTSELSKFSNSGDALSPPIGFTGGGLQFAAFLAIDGTGRVWIPTSDASISEFANDGTAISPATGYNGGALNVGSFRGVAVDGSGNVWLANGLGSSLTELVGAAAPVVTPLATAVKNNKLGQRP